MALVTLALTSDVVVLTYPTADLKDLRPPGSIQTLSETPELVAKLAAPALKECRPKILHRQAHLLEHL
jgi:hypothetical protein